MYWICQSSGSRRDVMRPRFTAYEVCPIHVRLFLKISQLALNGHSFGSDDGTVVIPATCCSSGAEDWSHRFSIDIEDLYRTPYPVA